MKKRERNGVSFFCLLDVSLQRYDTSKFEKNAFFTKLAAVHNFYIANSPWNLDLNSKNFKIWKNKQRMAFLRNILFCLSDISLQRYDSANRRPILEKTLFHTVGSCTLWPKQLTCLADGGGWREDQYMWDGQGLKDNCFFLKLFLESHHREKLNLWGRNWVHWQDNFLKED